MNQPLNLFFKEMQSTLDVIQAYLDDQVNGEVIFIRVHNLKGAASFLQFKNLQLICHGMEELLLQKKSDKASWLTLMDQMITEKVTLMENYLTLSEKESFSTLASRAQILAESQNKDVSFVLEETLSDLEEPNLLFINNLLRQLILNALEHGIEKKIEREQSKKNSKAKILIKLEKHNQQVIGRVTDDGRGLDMSSIMKRAQELKLDIPHNEKDLIFQPFFSTNKKVSPLSGRGMGLHGIKKEIEKKGGTFKVEDVPGEGCAFVFSFPLKAS